MSEEVNRISFDEFSENLMRIIDCVINEGTPVIIEKGDGELVKSNPSRQKNQAVG